MIITLLPKNLAKTGFSFIAGRGGEECKSCRFYKTCVENLKEGRIYTVINVRQIEHPCNVHDTGVKIVEVVESATEAAISSKYAIEGSSGIFSSFCNESCIHNELCNPEGVNIGDRFLILKVREKIDCPLGKSIVKVSIKRKD